MGASDAVGIGAFPLDNGYVYRVRDGLKARANTVDLYNLGVSGKRISYIESTELPAALIFEPDVVTIWAGPNDVVHGITVEGFEASLIRVLSQLRQSTSAVIVIANVPDMTKVPRFMIDPDSDVTGQRIAAYNDAIARQAAVYSVPVVDLFGGGYATDWNYVSIDGFHPNNEGHAKIAELFLDVILRYL
jgi:acyl-CoA thioesterase-1